MAVARAVVLLALALLLCTAHAFPKYLDELPNVPTVNGQQVRGVGHENPAGKGKLNSFGQDFAKAGHTWTAELCKMDSDGDGVSNGQELGDPKCTWKKGMARASSSGPITHPGNRNSKP